MKKILSKEVDLGLTNKGLVRKDPKETKTNKLADFTNYLTEHCSASRIGWETG